MEALCQKSPPAHTWRRLIALLPNRTSGQEILSLVQYSDSTGVQFWWSSPGAPDLSPLDRLFSAAEESPIIDVVQSDSSTQISQIYRVAELSETNARNLATLFDAEMVLTGRVEVSAPSPVANGLFWVVHSVLESRLLSVAMDVVHQEIHLSLVSRGSTPEGAVEEALYSLHMELSQRISAAVQMQWTGPDEGGGSSPSLVVYSPTSFVALDAFIHDLSAFDETIEEVVEGWSTAGRIAFHLKLADGAAWEDVTSAIDELEARSGMDYRLHVGENSEQTVFVEVVPVDVGVESVDVP